MKKQTVDAKGMLCPKPLIMTKKALKDFKGEVTVLIDNKTSWENVSRFLSDNSISFRSSEEGGIYSLIVEADGSGESMSNAEDYCPLPAAPVRKKTAAASGHVICFKSDKMGDGPEELGRILIQGFCSTIKETSPLPSALVFYNTGVLLAKEGSPVLDSLMELEKDGMKILVCGTCADYFGIKEQIKAGVISNMYDILSCLSSAGSVLNP
jgi:selenium metabolism protein YedF